MRLGTHAVYIGMNTITELQRRQQLSAALRAVALGPAPQAWGNNPLSSWLKDDALFELVFRYKRHQDFFSVLTEIEQRLTLLIIAEAIL